MGFKGGVFGVGERAGREKKHMKCEALQLLNKEKRKQWEKQPKSYNIHIEIDAKTHPNRHTYTNQTHIHTYTHNCNYSRHRLVEKVLEVARRDAKKSYI